jgi:hypothetical protein
LTRNVYNGIFPLMGKKTKRLLVPISPVLHAKLKWQAAQDGLSMSAVVRNLLSDYLDGKLVWEDPPTVQDQIAERLAESLRA